MKERKRAVLGDRRFRNPVEINDDHQQRFSTLLTKAATIGMKPNPLFLYHKQRRGQNSRGKGGE